MPDVDGIVMQRKLKLVHKYAALICVQTYVAYVPADFSWATNRKYPLPHFVCLHYMRFFSFMAMVYDAPPCCSPRLVGGGMARGRLLADVWIAVKACGLGRGLLDCQCAVDQVGQALEVCAALCIAAGILHLCLYALEGAQVVGAVYRGIG